MPAARSIRLTRYAISFGTVKAGAGNRCRPSTSSRIMGSIPLPSMRKATGRSVWKIDGRDAVVAVRLDGTGKGQTLFRHPHADVDGLVRVGRDQREIGRAHV